MEQWEIDLRQQLEGSANVGTRPAVETPPRPKPRPVHKQPRPRPTYQPSQHVAAQNYSTDSVGRSSMGSNNSPALVIVVVTLLGMLLLALNMKKNNGLFSVNRDQIVQRDQSDWTEKAPANDSLALSKLVQDVEDLQAKDKSIDERLALQDRRTTFLGMIHNNNFVVMKNNYNKDDLVFFNRDWTIDQMPKYLNLSSEDRAYLQRYIQR